MDELTAFSESYFCFGTVAAGSVPAPAGALVCGEVGCIGRCQIERNTRIPLVKPQRRGPTPVTYPPESYLGGPLDLLARWPLDLWQDSSSIQSHHQPVIIRSEQTGVVKHLLY